jgi:hypothetical protein
MESDKKDVPVTQSKKVERVEQKPAKSSLPKDIFDDFEEKPKPVKKANIDIFDIACEPSKIEKTETTLIDMSLESSAVSNPSPPQSNANLFDLLGNQPANEPSISPNSVQNNVYLSNNGYSQPMNSYPTNSALNFGLQSQNPYQSNSYANVSLSNNFQTENVTL